MSPSTTSRLGASCTQVRLQMYRTTRAMAARYFRCCVYGVDSTWVHVLYGCAVTEGWGCWCWGVLSPRVCICSMGVLSPRVGVAGAGVFQSTAGRRLQSKVSRVTWSASSPQTTSAIGCRHARPLTSCMREAFCTTVRPVDVACFLPCLATSWCSCIIGVTESLVCAVVGRVSQTTMAAWRTVTPPRHGTRSL